MGTQPPFTHWVPLGQVLESAQPATHWPSSQIFPGPQSLLYLQTLVLAVHAPAMHVWPVWQSVLVVQGQGPLLPPQAWQWFWMQTSPPGQSLLAVHSTGEPASVWVGGRQKPPVQTVPFAQSLLDLQVCSQPLLVQTWPAGQLVLPVHGLAGGGVTEPQPLATKALAPENAATTAPSRKAAAQVTALPIILVASESA